MSGGHLNPAVTVALAVVGKISWRKVPHYLAAQYLGALLAGCLVFLAYWDGLVWYEHQAGVFRSAVLHCHWSRSNEARLSLVERFIVLFAPAILCHKEPKPLVGGFGCPSWFYTA